MELQIPAGLTDMLQEFTVVVLRERPEDMVEFAANYFTLLKLQNKAGGGTNGVSVQSDEKQYDQEDEEDEILGSFCAGKSCFRCVCNFMRVIVYQVSCISPTFAYC